MDNTPTPSTPTPGVAEGSDLLKKEVVKKMPMSLDHMVLILEQAYKTLVNINDANLILAVGNTGCGKSTMMTSLMFGPDALEIKRGKKEIEVPIPGGGTKKKMVNTQCIDQKTDQGVFHIGHSTAESMTFMPQMYQREGDSTNTIYVDIAGTQDTGGDLIEFINIFVTKELFRRSKTVRFLVPIPNGQVTDCRGRGPRDQIKLIQQICEADLMQMIGAIQPIITRVKPADDEFDLITMRDTLKLQFQQEIQTQINSQVAIGAEDFMDEDDDESTDIT